MEIYIAEHKQDLGKQAAARGADLIRKAIEHNLEAHIIMATGTSQFEMLQALLEEPVDWAKVTVFHLDEYIGLPAYHPASFRKYLRERFARKVLLRQFVYINGDAEDPQEECDRLERLIEDCHIDVAFIGIGENGHLAFNDPPADFDTTAAFIPVQLDEACRKQQLGEGWFASLEEVPQRAITMTVRQILHSAAIICSVPDGRKAEAVKNTVQGEITPMVPASILQDHPAVWLYLDKDSAALL